MLNLINKIKKTGNPSVIGLDARLEYIPDFILERSINLYGKTLKAVSEALLEFNVGIIDAIYNVVPSIKIQIAYYELLGVEGIICFKQTIAYAKKKGLYVIADIKRSDIGTTAEAYAQAYLGKFRIKDVEIRPFGDIDGVTINPYLGTDGIIPFLKELNVNKSIFILTKTSNQSSGEIQNKISNDGKFLYEDVANIINFLGKDYLNEYGYSSVGAVVGATYPKEQKKLRNIMKNNYFLVPGYGVQGARACDITNSFNKDGLGAIVNSSRGIICAWKKNNNLDFMEAAYNAVIEMRNDIVAHIK